MSSNPYAPSDIPPSEETPQTPTGNQMTPAPDTTASPTSSSPVLGEPEDKRPRNRLGLIALTFSVIGIFLGIFPATRLLGWAFLLTSLITGIIGMRQQAKEKITPFLAMTLSLLGAVISGIMLFFGSIITASYQANQTPPASEIPSNSSEQSPDLASAPSTLAEPTIVPSLASPQPSSEAVIQTPAAEKDKTVPHDYKSALAEARSYIKVMGFSYAGLYHQLTSEYGGKYSPEATQYAMDNLDVDWNAEALESAQNYIDSMAFSQKGLYNQLTGKYGEQFTPEQAQYAVNNVKVDWNAEALEAAHGYLKTTNMSKESLYDQLTSDYGEQFTPEQARYAIDHL